MESNHSVRMLIGFGNINVKLKRDNDDKEYPYVLGAHGYCVISINDKDKFSSKFGKNTSIESNKIRKSTIGIIKQLCSESLSDYCISKCLTPSEIQLKTDDISKHLFQVVSVSLELESFGLVATELAIESISMNEPDESNEYEIVKSNSAAKIISGIAVFAAILAIALITILPSINNKTSNTSSNETVIVTSEKDTITEDVTTEETKPSNQFKYGETCVYDNLKLRYDFDGWCVYECKAGTAELCIPDVVNGIPIYRIDNGVFEDFQILESIKLPDTLRIIGNEAFAGCTSLKEMVFPKSLQSIGSHAFSNCFNIKSIVIPNGVTSIGHCAFSDCERLTTVSIPSSVISIGDGFVSYCGILEELTVDLKNPVYASIGNCIIENESKTLVAGCNSSIIPDDGSVKIIGDSAFAGLNSITNIVIPEGVESVGRCAFIDCRNLKSIRLPSSIKELGDGAIYGCESLKQVYVSDLKTWLNIKFAAWSNPLVFATDFYVNGKLTTDIVIPDDFDVINDRVFDNFDSDYTIVLPDSIKSIGLGAFYQSEGLHSIIIPDNVTTIGEEAFWNCINLTSIVLGKGLTNIDVDAFSACVELKTIYYTGTEEEFKKIHICMGNDIFYYVQIIYNYQPS